GKRVLRSATSFADTLAVTAPSFRPRNERRDSRLVLPSLRTRPWGRASLWPCAQMDSAHSGAPIELSECRPWTTEVREIRQLTRTNSGLRGQGPTDSLKRRSF